MVAEADPSECSHQEIPQTYWSKKSRRGKEQAKERIDRHGRPWRHGKVGLSSAGWLAAILLSWSPRRRTGRWTRHDAGYKDVRAVEKVVFSVVVGAQVNYSLDVSVKLARPVPFDRLVSSGKVNVGRNWMFADNMWRNWHKVTSDITKGTVYTDASTRTIERPRLLERLCCRLPKKRENMCRSFQLFGNETCLR